MGNYRSSMPILAAFLATAVALSGGAFAGCPSCGGGGTWSSGLSFIGASMEGASSAGFASGTAGGAVQNLPSSAITARALYEDRMGEKRLVMAYAGVPGDESYIEGSIHLPLDQVFHADDGLKSPAEIAAIFGAAGISEDDPLVIYGDSFVNGYDTFAFWMMKYLGHRDVRLLEGTKGGRKAAGLQFVETSTPRAPETYSPNPNLDLFASADELAGRQLVDPRTAAEYNAGHLDGAIHIEYSRVMGSNGLASSQALAQAFGGLDKDQQVVVYSSKGGVASMVWYPLYSMEYDAALSILT